MTSPGLNLMELCADNRTVPVLGGGMHLNVGLPTDVDTAQMTAADTRERPPFVTPLTFDRSGVGQPLATRFLERVPPEALDLMVYLPPADRTAAATDPAVLLDEAGRLGIPIDVPVSTLSERGWPPEARHRIVPLDATGRPALLERAATVRVLPPRSRSFDAYQDATDDVAALVLGRAYLPGRIVFGPEGTRLGVPAGLADRAYGTALGIFGRGLDVRDLEDTEGVRVDGYADLMRHLEDLPAGGQALVRTDDRIFLAHRSAEGAVSVLDPARAGAATLPADPAEIDLHVLPATATLEGQLDRLNVKLFGSPYPPATWTVNLPPGARTLTGTAAGTASDSRSHELVVLGPAHESEQTLNDLRDSLAAIDQPVLLVSVDRVGQDVGEQRITEVRNLLEQYAWQGQVPLVVTRGSEAGLTDVLDAYGATLIHKVVDQPAAGTGLNLGTDWNWTVRGKDGVTGATGRELSPVLDGIGTKDTRPAVGRPPERLASYLSKPLTAHDLAELTELSSGLKTMRPFVQQIVARDATFAGYHAALELTGMGQGEAVHQYLGTDQGRGSKIFGSLLNVKGETGEARQAAVQEMLPHLNSLAQGVGNSAGEVLMRVLDGVMDSSMPAETARHEIQLRKQELAGEDRVELAQHIATLTKMLPAERQSTMDEFAVMVMDCFN